MSLQRYLAEYETVGIGEILYPLITATVRAVVFGHSYPPSYSPTKTWDDAALSALAHDWSIDKLLRAGHLENLLLANETERGLKRGLELSFMHFLIGRRQRNELSNLFQRAHAMLDGDERFQCFIGASKKAERWWGLAAWEGRGPFAGADQELIAAAFLIGDVVPIQYSAYARKHSPVLLDKDLAAFLHRLFSEVGAFLRLGHLTTVFRYRFALLDAEVLSLDEPLGGDENGRTNTLADTVGSSGTPEDVVVVQETAAAIIRGLSALQQVALVEYARPDATLESVAARLGRSKSSAENYVKGALRVVAANTDNLNDAQAAYARVVELLSEPTSE